MIVKWAQSIDGKLAWTNPPKNGNWISNELSRADVQQLRKRTQAILTGVDTVIADNPRLTVRIPGETNDRPPLRVVIDSQLRTPWDCRLITIHEAPTIIVTTHQTAGTEFQQVEKLKSAGVEVVTVGEQDGHCNLEETLAQLGDAGVQQLLIETGPTLITEFLRQELADELKIYIAPMILGQNGTADLPEQLNARVKHQNLKNIQIQSFDKDICISGLL